MRAVPHSPPPRSTALTLFSLHISFFPPSAHLITKGKHSKNVFLAFSWQIADNGEHTQKRKHCVCVYACVCYLLAICIASALSGIQFGHSPEELQLLK